MLPLVAWQQQSIAELINNSSTYDAMHGLDSTFIPDKETRDVMEWIRVMMELVNKLVTIFDTFNQGLLWIPQTFMTKSIASNCATFVKNHMSNRWQFHIYCYNAAAFEDAVVVRLQRHGSRQDGQWSVLGATRFCSMYPG